MPSGMVNGRRRASCQRLSVPWGPEHRRRGGRGAGTLLSLHRYPSEALCDICDFAKHLDGTFGGGQCGEQLPVILQPLDGMREEPPQPA